MTRRSFCLIFAGSSGVPVDANNSRAPRYSPAPPPAPARSDCPKSSAQEQSAADPDSRASPAPPRESKRATSDNRHRYVPCHRAERDRLIARGERLGRQYHPGFLLRAGIGDRIAGAFDDLNRLVDLRAVGAPSTASVRSPAPSRRREPKSMRVRLSLSFAWARLSLAAAKTFAARPRSPSKASAAAICARANGVVKTGSRASAR